MAGVIAELEKMHEVAADIAAARSVDLAFA
jgi:hypothetical protein